MILLLIVIGSLKQQPLKVAAIPLPSKMTIFFNIKLLCEVGVYQMTPLVRKVYATANLVTV